MLILVFATGVFQLLPAVSLLGPDQKAWDDPKIVVLPAATLVLALPIETWSLKISHDWPEDPPEDVDGPAWAGLLPLETAYAVPVAAPDLRDGIDVPPSVRRLSGQQQTPKPPT